MKPMSILPGAIIAAWTLGASVETCFAQTPLAEDLKLQPFIYGAVGGFPSGSGGSVTYGGGGGVDGLLYEGLALGGDLSIFGNGTFSFAVAVFNVSYHFMVGESRSVPFIKAGFGAGGEGGAGVGFFSFGGGVNLWSNHGRAFRLEVVDRFPAEGGDHHINAQFGLTW